MTWKLYLDDIRKPPDDTFQLAVSYVDAVEMVGRLGCPDFISFDHDLALDHYAGETTEEKTGYDFAKWLIESDMDGGIHIPDNFTFKVHSMNPVGKANIQYLVGNYLRARGKAE